MVAGSNLTGDSLHLALSRRGFEVAVVPPPSSAEEAHHLDLRLRAFGPSAAVLLEELPSSGPHPAAMRALRESGHRWLLLTATPRGPEWGESLAAGASAVLSLGTSLDALTDVLGRLCRAERAMVPAERERLIAQWAEMALLRAISRRCPDPR